MVKLLKKFIVFTFAIMLLAIPLSGCADNENNEENDEPNTPGNESGAEENVLALTKSVYILTVGGSEQLKIDFKENGQTAYVGLLTISSKNTDVATVSNGTVSGVALGQTEISVSRGDTVLTVPVYLVEEATLEQVNSFDEQYINIYGRSYLRTENSSLTIQPTVSICFLKAKLFPLRLRRPQTVICVCL